jgi:hypothetical protein
MNARAMSDSLIALMMEAVQTSETSLHSYQSTRRYNPEDNHLHIHLHENLKSYRTVRSCVYVIFTVWNLYLRLYYLRVSYGIFLYYLSIIYLRILMYVHYLVLYLLLFCDNVLVYYIATCFVVSINSVKENK